MMLNETRSEECTMTLDYAWYHVFGCSMLVFLLWFYKQTKHFRVGHIFGMFAMLMDYGYMYLTKGTRTIRVVRDEASEDFDDLYGFGTFLFFAWFDYFGAFALIVFACHLSDALRSLQNKETVSRFDALVVLQHTIMWWTAPLFSPTLNIDDRTVVLSRSTSVQVYIILLIFFTFLLVLQQKIAISSYKVVIGSGIGCGLLHHAPLFAFGMRGYDSIFRLILTLCTEWPALMCGVTYIRRQFASLEKSGQNAMLILLIGMMMPYFPNDEQATEYLISIVPGHHMQTFGTNYIRFKTCILPRFQQHKTEGLPCFDEGDKSIRVISSPAKSGAVLSVKILLDIAIECRLCLASGTRDSPGIPGPGTHVPNYHGQLLHALMDMEWPRYVQSHSIDGAKCVSITRDPLNRLVSFYTYARSGGEHWLRYDTDIMTSLRTAPNITASVELFWNRIGKTYLQTSHESYLREDARGCYELKFEDLTGDFQSGLNSILAVFGISSPDVKSRLVERLMRHDHSHMTSPEEKKMLTKDMHVSSSKFTTEFKTQVVKILMNDIEGVRNMITKMRLEMERLRAVPIL